MGSFFFLRDLRCVFPFLNRARKRPQKGQKGKFGKILDCAIGRIGGKVLVPSLDSDTEKVQTLLIVSHSGWLRGWFLQGGFSWGLWSLASWLSLLSKRLSTCRAPCRVTSARMEHGVEGLGALPRRLAGRGGRVADEGRCCAARLLDPHQHF